MVNREPDWYVANTGFVNPGTTIMEKNIGTFYLIQEKSDPRSPNSMLIRVMLSEASARSPNIDRWGRGRIEIKARNSPFIVSNVMPHFLFCGKYRESCNQLHKVYQLFFP